MIINTKFRKTACHGLQVYLWSSAKPFFLSGWMKEWVNEWMRCLCWWLKWRKSWRILDISVSRWVSIATPMLKKIFESSSFPSCFRYESFSSSLRHSGTPNCLWCKVSAKCERVGCVFKIFFPNHLAFWQMTQLSAICRWTFSKLQIIGG